MSKPLFLVITGLLTVSAAPSSLATAGEHLLSRGKGMRRVAVTGSGA